MTVIAPRSSSRSRAIELRTRGLVGSLFAGEYRSVFRGQGMEFAEVRAYEHGDDFRTIDWNVSARLASPVRQDLHRGARAHADAGGGPVGLHPVRRAGDQGGARGGGGRGAGARRRAPERPGGRAALRRRGGARDPAAEGAPARAAGDPRSGRLRAGRPAHQPRRQPLLRQPAAAAPQHRGRPLRLPRRRLGAAAPPARRAPRGRGRHGGRSAGARAARVRLDRDAGRRDRAAGCWWTPAAATCARRVSGSRSGAGRSGRARSPPPASTRCTLETGVPTTRSPLRRAFALRARRIHRG